MANTIIDPREFRRNAQQMASVLLREWVGEERAAEATGRIASALAASAASAKKPEEFYACTQQSVCSVIAISALTGIMPSTGATALAYAIPRRPRKDDPPNLTYQLSHRGICALARRAGLSLVAVPIGVNDEIEVDDCGQVNVKSRDIDNPPMDEASLRGVIVIVRQLDSGLVIAKGWVPKSIINARRAVSDSYKYAEKPSNSWAKSSSTWHAWYVEMAIKTALHYAIGRGWAVIDDTEAVRALSADIKSDSTHDDSDVIEQVPRGNAGLRGKLGLTDEGSDDSGATDGVDYRSLLAKAITINHLRNISQQLESDDTVPTDEKDILFGELNDKVALLEENAGATA